MLDRVQLEEDSSNSVSIRGGRRFVVQEGSAKVMPGSFGLTVVEPKYIYVRRTCIFPALVPWSFALFAHFSVFFG